MSCLPEVDHIIMLDNGFIVESGSFEELTTKEGVFSKFVNNYFTTNDDESESEDDEKKEITDRYNLSIISHSVRS